MLGLGSFCSHCSALVSYVPAPGNIHLYRAVLNRTLPCALAVVVNLTVVALPKMIGLDLLLFRIDQEIEGLSLLGVEPGLDPFVPAGSGLGDDFRDQLGPAGHPLAHLPAQDHDIGTHYSILGDLP